MEQLTGKDEQELKREFRLLKVLKEDAGELIRPVKPFTVADYLVVFIVLLSMLLFCDAESLVQTSGASFGYLNRRFLDFYEYGRECGIRELSYMPLIYVIYAVWNLPLKLTFLVRYPMPEVPLFVLVWYKLLPILLYLGCAYLVYKIACEIGMGKKKAKLCAAAAFTMPVGFFLQFSYWSVIVIPLFFVILGLFFYLRNNRWGFVGCFAAAIGCLQYVCVLFLPLLLLKEKRLRRLCEDIVVAVAPFLLECLVYQNHPILFQNVKLFDINANFEAGLNIGIFVIQYVLFFFVMILGWSYFTHTRSKKELAAYAVFFVGLSGTITLCLTNWKPELFMLLVPISVLGAFLHKDIRIFMILDIGWAGLIVAYMAIKRFELGGIDMVASLYTILLLVIVGFKHPRFLAEKAEELPLICTGWLRTRFLAGAVLGIIWMLAVMLFGA